MGPAPFHKGKSGDFRRVPGAQCYWARGVDAIAFEVSRLIQLEPRAAGAFFIVSAGSTRLSPP
jgi:hypothetical protein